MINGVFRVSEWYKLVFCTKVNAHKQHLALQRDTTRWQCEYYLPRLFSLTAQFGSNINKYISFTLCLLKFLDLNEKQKERVPHPMTLVPSMLPSLSPM